MATVAMLAHTLNTCTHAQIQHRRMEAASKGQESREKEPIPLPHQREWTTTTAPQASLSPCFYFQGNLK